MENRHHDACGARTYAADVCSSFADLGFAMLRGAVRPDTVADFVKQIQAELELESECGASVGDVGKAAAAPQGERTIGALSLHDSSTWPKKGARRVVETAPTGVDQDNPDRLLPHWKDFLECEALGCALDALLGVGNWTLPVNIVPHKGCADNGSASALGEIGVRHWYFPITFPEDLYCGKQPASGVSDESTCDEHAMEPSQRNQFTNDCGGHIDTLRCRPVSLCTWKDEVQEKPFTCEVVDAPLRWQPVSRRRVRGKGWHIDVGPGFHGHELRFQHGHPTQGLVILLLLSDCDAGGGGTVLWPRSQEIVRQRLREHPGGISHDELNRWCLDYTLDRVRNGTLQIGPITGESGEPAANVVQVVGKAGDIVLMHPWLVHAGSTNLRSTVRLMGNGMARVKDLSRRSAYVL